MADFDEFDTVLREAFARAAQPGDPSGVAATIRSRIAGGATGTPASGPAAPGVGGALSWLPWIGVIVVAGVVGTTLGVTGVFGNPIDDLKVVDYTSVLDGSAPAAACPGGPVVATLGAGTRVLTVQRSEDSAWLGVRNPNDVSDVLWLASTHLVIDQEQAAVSGLPVGEACPEVFVATPAPAPAPAPEPGPVPPPAPAPGPPADTTKPTIGTPTANPNPVYNLNPVVISVSAADNVGVNSVLISWSGQFTSSSTMTYSAGVWKYTFTPTDAAGGDITFTLRAKDAAGNLSNPVSVVVDHQYFG